MRCLKHWLNEVLKVRTTKLRLYRAAFCFQARNCRAQGGIDRSGADCKSPGEFYWGAIHDSSLVRRRIRRWDQRFDYGRTIPPQLFAVWRGIEDARHSSRLLSLAAVRICWPRLAGDSGQSALPCLATPVEQHVGVHAVPPGYLGDRRARH